MKEISRAYADRDLARLLDLKRIWLSGGTATPDHDEDKIGRRCANLERMNADLRAQARKLGQDLKELRRSPLAKMLRALRRSPEGVGQDPVAALIAQAREELRRSRELRDFVVSFRDGKITVDDFIRGPASLRHPPPTTTVKIPIRRLSKLSLRVRRAEPARQDHTHGRAGGAAANRSASSASHKTYRSRQHPRGRNHSPGSAERGDLIDDISPLPRGTLVLHTLICDPRPDGQSAARR